MRMVAFGDKLRRGKLSAYVGSIPCLNHIGLQWLHVKIPKEDIKPRGRAHGCMGEEMTWGLRENPLLQKSTRANWNFEGH